MNDQDHIQYRDGVPPHCPVPWLPGMRIIDSPNFDERPHGTVIDTVILHYISPNISRGMPLPASLPTAWMHRPIPVLRGWKA